MLLEQERRDVCLTARRLVDAGIAGGGAGTVSTRAGDLVVLTPAGVALDRLDPGDCPVLALDGRLLEGRREPAAETTLHMGIYRTTDAGAVVHAHGENTAAVSAVLAELPPVHHRAAALGGAVPVAPYATYGTAELSDQVCKALKAKRAALLANHGGVAIGRDLGEALEHARLLEWLCGVYVRARAIGEPRVLSEDELAEVRRRDGYGWGGPDIWP
ncbi:class II aldolase/adducin family protein [Marinitenerispora sediminis]|uniref:Fuculose phosphate aldolase n=1 Tax=Marinitenerispora sediminis TaxID=1931232 RepID=A0A368TDU4_9ACTN|nr:class II aldolase/adducin family protein [Marinitenerispora sediminis]RCV50782.1 fuculose phosphate aldolase [Marinitenerispora sediminis]RCV52664.1 fuculose phosphate aldolase [Marinitenerispora sediminis]RCV62080.1 fuculose phosphate aldolase [Marinitenerispora sediminis]